MEGVSHDHFSGTSCGFVFSEATALGVVATREISLNTLACKDSDGMFKRKIRFQAPVEDKGGVSAIERAYLWSLAGPDGPVEPLHSQLQAGLKP